MGTLPSERATRKDRIDRQLSAHGWTVTDYDPVRPFATYHNVAVEEFPTANGPADYALFTQGQLIGIVEAKRISVGPQNVLTQAERYARGIDHQTAFNFNGLRAPFLYSTNGELIWFHDVRHPLNRSHRIASFHTPAALDEKLGRDLDAACRQLQVLPNTHPLLRTYQIEANLSTEEALAERKRQMLIAMATGTGKTFTLVNQIYRFMKSGFGRRILFLVDRRALAAQAVREFASFEAEPGLKFDKIYEVYSQRFRHEDFGEDEKFDPKVLPKRYLMDPQAGQAFVYICTIQRMMINLFGRDVLPGLPEEPEEDVGKLDIPIHAFDVVIADECHRGYTAQEDAIWRQTLDHFDAVKIGLTATPAAHTKAYFKDVVYRYEYERAVREGYLVDYDVVNVKSNVRMNGIFLQAGEHVRVINPETGAEQMDSLEDERKFNTTEIEQKITAPDSNRKILEEMRKYALAHEQRYGRFPKTLIFAVNDLPHTSHADQLVDLARDVFGRGDSFVQKITGRVDRPLQRIREFRNRPEPGIVVSVDLLSTGVDIPDLEYIVFLRPVKSRILFEQMLGRGTRKGFRFPDKSHFTVFDCFDGTLLAYFRQATGITVEPPDKPTRSLAEVVTAIWENKERQYNIRCLVKRIQRVAKETTGEGRERFQAYLGEDIANYARTLPQRLTDDFAGAIAVLRDPAFQAMLTDYPRAPRIFYVADEAEDTVTSEWLVREEGKEYMPEDYLATFSRFVQENPAHIEAIEILLDRPQDWGTEALKELRQKLASGPQRFTIPNLQKAYQVRYHKALVDLISMIKHAAREREPLLTPEERVDNAVAAVMAGQHFTEAQQKWLTRIRDHLVENLSISPEDFDSLPVFERVGGWGRANSTFDGKLAALLKRLNGAIAA
jgi:type I restriction enzyme R subunit